jgi:nitrate reductase NapE component
MKNIRKYIAIFTALSIAGVAAFFSVSGIAKLFAGSSMAVMIMAAVLEVGKIITASLLERHWNELKTSLKIYLSIGVLVLMTITSVGIYGFLSSAYQETAYKVENINKQVSVLDIKRVA